jgi:hypothetical protein
VLCGIVFAYLCPEPTGGSSEERRLFNPRQWNECILRRLPRGVGRVGRKPDDHTETLPGIRKTQGLELVSLYMHELRAHNRLRSMRALRGGEEHGPPLTKTVAELRYRTCTESAQFSGDVCNVHNGRI